MGDIIKASGKFKSSVQFWMLRTVLWVTSDLIWNLKDGKLKQEGVVANVYA